MDVIDLKSREVFGNDGRGVAALVEEPNLKIRQLGLEPGKERSRPHDGRPGDHPGGPRRGGLHRRGGEHPDRAGEAAPHRPGRVDGDRQRLGRALWSFSPSGRRFRRRPRATRRSAGRRGAYVNLVDFAPLKPGKQEAFLDWFRRSSEVFARHRGFISRTLLAPIEGGSRYAAIVEHESKETFMDMHLSDDRAELFQEVEPLVLGASTPHFYELLISYRSKK